MRKQTNETCPLCPNHCPADNLKCGKGHAHFMNGSETTENRHPHRKYFKGFDGGRKEHFTTEPSKDSLLYLLLYSSHRLHEMRHKGSMEDEKHIFACLDETEQNQLKTLLQKLLTHWGQYETKTKS